MQASKRIQQQATEWVVKTDLGPLTPEESTQFHAWLNADPRNRGAYVRANAMRVNVERISVLAGGVAPKAQVSFSYFPHAIAASLAAVAVAITLGWFAYQANGDRYSSGIGELRKVALDDGSSIFLNTATQAVVHFGEAAREVDLPRGEALFEVAKNAARPFVVHAGDVTVKAIGTAFSVRHDESRIEVTVTEGVVELIQKDGPGARLLTADHRAVIGRAKSIGVQALSRRETERQLAWRTGRLEFDGQTLNEAVAQINRHNRRQIVIADAQLAHRSVVGVFRSTDIEAFAYISAAALNAQVVVDGGTIRLESRGAP